MKHLYLLVMLIFFTTILDSNIYAQERVRSEKYVMQTDQLVSQVEDIKSYLSRETKFKAEYPEISDTIEDHTNPRMDYFLKAKKAFQEGEMKIAVQSLRSAREIINNDVRQLSKVRDREATSEILRLERELGRNVDSLLRDF